MITNIKITLKKQNSFDANQIEKQFEKMKLDVLRWAVVDITDTEYIIDAAVVKKN